jgi:hypothetical protein
MLAVLSESGRGSGWAQGLTDLAVNIAAEGQSPNCLGEDLSRFMGGQQFNGFVVPEVRAADVELVPVTYAQADAGGRKAMY